MTGILRRERDPWAAGVRADQVAMGSGVVLLADGSSLHIGSPDGTEPARRLAGLAHPVGGLAVSPSGRFGLLRSEEHNWAAVVDLVSGATLATFGGHDARPRTAVAAFGTLDGHDVLFLCRTPYTLEILAVPGFESLAAAQYLEGMAFRFRSLHPVNDDYLVAIGVGEIDGNLSFLTVSVPELLSDPAAAATEFLRRRDPFDYVYSLSAGPCGGDSVVVHRDPLIDLDDPDDPLDDDEPNADIDNLHGFYIRRLRDGQLVERIDYTGAFPMEAPMFATGSAIVAGLDGRVVAYPRGAEATPAEIEARVYGFDVATGSVVVARPEGTVEVFEAER